MRVLIAEDDRVSRRLLERKLASWGYEVVSCANGAEAWQELHARSAPNLAILNWMMPGIDGIDLCREVRKEKRLAYVYIILLTGKDRKRDIIEGIGAGADDYMTKPFNPQELRVRLRTGRRILEMQTTLMQREKLQGALEMAGATCHELNQPMQVVSGYSELLLRQVGEDSRLFGQISKIQEAIETMIQITRKLQTITKYETRQYIKGSRIIDIDKASETGSDELDPVAALTDSEVE
jgi:sigma-B regulation protein RsbU (phosphoserine phosphatase)